MTKYISIYHCSTFKIRVHLNCKRLIQNSSLVPSDQETARKSGGHIKVMSWRGHIRAGHKQQTLLTCLASAVYHTKNLICTDP